MLTDSATTLCYNHAAGQFKKRILRYLSFPNSVSQIKEVPTRWTRTNEANRGADHNPHSLGPKSLLKESHIIYLSSINQSRHLKFFLRNLLPPNIYIVPHGWEG